ncbi:ATP-binding protein, partial [Couchioplanes caeruleus]|uniref:ATP-binding protein n=1 Tax=Couchioplanes caeruleus TaxID=56438 RepID=UPI00200E2E91
MTTASAPEPAQRPGASAGAASSRRDPAVAVPSYLSLFVGRDRERATLAAWTCPRRCVTVTGPGGVGKTRLVAEMLRGRARRGGRRRGGTGPA